MRIQFRELSIECDASELPSAMEALRAMASLAPQSAPIASAHGSRPLVASAPSDALRDLLRAKGIGFKYRPDGKDKGETLESALAKACKLAGASDAEIESAMTSAPLGNALGEMDVPNIGADDGEELV